MDENITPSMIIKKILLESSKTPWDIPPNCHAMTMNTYVHFYTGDLKMCLDDFYNKYFSKISDMSCNLWMGHSYIKLSDCIDPTSLKLMPVDGINFTAIITNKNVSLKIVQAYDISIDEWIIRIDALIFPRKI